MSKAIIIGDSTHNTLSIIRSLGIEKIPFVLILKCEEDTCNVLKSKYVRRNQVFRIETIDECSAILNAYEEKNKPYLICTFDEAAEWVDKNEHALSKKFITPCRGNQIGNLFNKEEQCKLAEQCGLTVPQTVYFSRDNVPELFPIDFPIIIKPLYSTGGEKGDIHICRTQNDLDKAIENTEHCDCFVAQEFIDKEYELNCVGVSLDNGIIVPGAIRKIRHYPLVTGACSFGEYVLAKDLNINWNGLEQFIKSVNYHGPFSAEFLHYNGKDFFLEVNFRNDGLAYTPVIAGANLQAMYLDHNVSYNSEKVHQIFMMNYSVDYLHVKEERLSKVQWWRDFFRTRCFINMSFRDPMPVLAHYLQKFN